jgi:hypothetical protein
MILFQKDWSLFPTAIIDTETTNRSFVRQAMVYKQMGVKNNAFILALVNPDLQGVDPFSKNLTPHQEFLIALECKINPWYFFREIARVPSSGSLTATPLEANRGNIALFWLFFNHITLFLIQIRQTGKSLSVNTLATYLINVRCVNTQINLLTKDDNLRSDNIQRLKDIDSELPHYLKQRTKRDANNTEEITIGSLGNSFKAHVPQKSPKAALNVGRGLTSPIFLIDEGPFQSNIGISMPAALAAGTAARDIARVNGDPYGTILTTTAGKKDDRDGKEIYTRLSQSAEYSERFFDCHDTTELEAMIVSNCPGGKLRVNCTFNHKQLGKSDQWLRKAIDETENNDPESIDRDFFNVWTSGTMTSPLTVKVLEEMRKSEQEESYISIDPPYAYLTKWFIDEADIEKRMASGHYVMGMDTSDASGGDDISLFITDVSTAETIAAGTYNETNLITFAQWLCTWFTRFENLTLIIERKSSGVAIIDYLLWMLPSLGIDPFKRIFNTVVNDHKENPERFKEINVPMGRRNKDVYVIYKKNFGFATAGSGMASRSDLYSNTLQLAAKKAGDKIKHKLTINQVTSLVTINGRVDHMPGENDDMVIAWLLCFWLITLGKNLTFYGIDSRNIFSEVDRKEIKTAQEYMVNQEQQEIRQKIEGLYEEIDKEQDSFVIQKLEHTLRMLNRQLVLEDGEIFSVDELINSLREKKRNARKEYRPMDDRFNKMQRDYSTNIRYRGVNSNDVVTY